MPRLSCHALTIHCPSVQNSPYRCTPVHACHASIIPTVPLPSIPIAFTYHAHRSRTVRAFLSAPLLPLQSYPVQSTACRPLPTLLSSPARPLHVQSLPDPDAPRQPASAIPCLHFHTPPCLTLHAYRHLLLLSYPSFPCLLCL